MPEAGKSRVFGIAVDVLDTAEAIRRILADCRARRGGYVVTANLDHAIKLRGDRAFRAAYDGARLVLADGMPLVWASRLRGPALPERVAGSDLVRPLCAAAARQGCSVFLLGTTLPALAAAARRLCAESPALVIAGAYAPGGGFSAESPENAEIAARLQSARPDLLLLALGAPKQELWARRWAGTTGIGMAICVGAGLDFIAGHQQRAPRWLRRLGLEWLHRALSQPARLGPRYLRNLLWLPRLLLEQLISRHSSPTGDQH